MVMEQISVAESHDTGPQEKECPAVEASPPVVFCVYPTLQVKVSAADMQLAVSRPCPVQ